ncbi:hypothetical protein [Brevirhabdus sp.]|uniref:hypothetical protein n=1 Tax=Brevirhabdus sp. TaxID=2004514 RepID=UPI0040587802
MKIEAKENALHAGGPLEGKTVMVVEDEAILGMMLSEELSAVGAKVVGPFPRLADGLEYCAETLPHLAVLDIDLLDSDSLPLARKLRESEIPFLFYTSRAESEDLKREFPQTPICDKMMPVDKLIGAVRRLV